MKIYLIEFSLIDDGGVEPVAFRTRESAEKWIDNAENDPAKISYGFGIVEAELCD